MRGGRGKGVQIYVGREKENWVGTRKTRDRERTRRCGVVLCDDDTAETASTALAQYRLLNS